MIDCWSNFCGKSNPFGACVPSATCWIVRVFAVERKFSCLQLLRWEKLARADFDNQKHWSYISLSCAVCPTLSIGVGCLCSICFLLNSNKCFSMQLSNAPHVDVDDDGDKNEDDDQGRLGVFILSVTSIEDMGRRAGGYWGHHHRISNLEGEKWRPAFNVAPNFIQCPCPPGSRFQTQ